MNESHSTININIGRFGSSDFEPYVRNKAKEFELDIKMKNLGGIINVEYSIDVEGDRDKIKEFDRSLNIWRM